MPPSRTPPLAEVDAFVAEQDDSIHVHHVVPRRRDVQRVADYRMVVGETTGVALRESPPRARCRWRGRARSRPSARSEIEEIRRESPRWHFPETPNAELYHQRHMPWEDQVPRTSAQDEALFRSPGPARSSCAYSSVLAPSKELSTVPESAAIHRPPLSARTTVPGTPTASPEGPGLAARIFKVRLPSVVKAPGRGERPRTRFVTDTASAFQSMRPCSRVSGGANVARAESCGMGLRSPRTARGRSLDDSGPPVLRAAPRAFPASSSGKRESPHRRPAPVSSPESICMREKPVFVLPSNERPLDWRAPR